MIGRPFVIFLFFLSITAIWFDGEERWGRGEAAFVFCFGFVCLFGFGFHSLASDGRAGPMAGSERRPKRIRSDG